MIERLSAVDASLLTLDGPTSVGHVCVMALLEDDVTLVELRATVERHIVRVPILRWRLRATPFGIDRPYWVDDPDFELTDHLIEVTLSPEAGDRELADLVAAISAIHLDRRRPLWELHLVHVPSGGYAALVIKLHHAAFDGIASRELLTALLVNDDDASCSDHPGVGDSGAIDTGGVETVDPGDPVDPEASVRDPWRPGPVPGALEMMTRTALGLIDVPGAALRLQRRLLEQLPRVATSGANWISRQSIEWLTGSAPAADAGAAAAQGTQGVSIPNVSAPPTPFNKAISSDRSWAYASIEIASIKAVRRAVGATVNDVVLAITAGGLRSWLLDQGALPEDPLRALVPVSVRPADDSDTGNQVGLMMCSLPTDEPDPLTRLRDVVKATALAKARRTMSPDTLEDLTRFAVPALATVILNVAHQSRLADHARLPFNIVVSNVPGQREPLELVGRRLGGLFVLSMLTDSLGINLTVQGYRDRLHIGVVACPWLVPDVWGLLDHFLVAHEELVEAGS